MRSMLGGRSARLRVLCLISGFQWARISVGLNDVKGSWDSARLDLGHNLYSTQYAHNKSPFGCASEAQSQTVDAKERDVCLCGASSSVRPLQVYRAWGIVPSWDSSTSTSSSRMPFAPATVISPSTSAMSTLALSSLSSPPPLRQVQLYILKNGNQHGRLRPQSSHHRLYLPLHHLWIRPVLLLCTGPHR